MRAALLALAVLATPAEAAQRCDRACLTGLAERYMDAMAAHRTDGVQWAARVRFAENGVPMQIGDGLWGSITAHGKAGLVAADPDSGTVAWMGMVEEHGQPGFYGMRLKVVDGGVAEVESVVRRQQGKPPFGDPVRFAYDPAFAARVPAGARSPREALRALVDGYYNGVVAGDGAPLTRFAAACRRVENGLPAEPLGVAGCEEQARLGLSAGTDRVRRRIAVIDEERGVAVAIGFSDHSARRQQLATTDGRHFPALAAYPHAQAFVAAFKLADGAIARVEEVRTEVGYGMPAPFRE